MNKLVTDQDTDIVFFSPWIKRFKCYKTIDKVLRFFEIKHEFLCSTKDYWARDYMPIQINDNYLVQYCYNPDYLREKKEYITDPTQCCSRLRQTPTLTDVIIDGGNVIKCHDSVIMTDKVFKENSKNYSRIDLLNKLEELFKAELIVIPWDKAESFGHADGMVRYIRENQLLLTNYQDFDNLLRKKILKSLGSKFEIIELHYDVSKPSENNWAYINYLRTKDIILLPWLGIEEDNQAIKQFESLFPEYKRRIVPIDTRSLIKLGGALNCISWNVKSNQGFRDYCSAVQRFKSVSSCIKLTDNINKEGKQWN